MVHFSLSQTRNEAGCDSLTLCQLLYNKKAELASPCGPAGSAVLDQTIKQVPTGRHARTVGTHTGKLSAESVRAALRRVRGSALNFVPRGIPGGRNFCPAYAGRNGFPLERVAFATRWIGRLRCAV